MDRSLLKILCLLSAAGIALAGCAAAPIAAGALPVQRKGTVDASAVAQLLTIPKLRRAPGIEGGNLKGFQRGLRSELKDAEMVILYADEWDGAHDLGGTVWLAYSGKSLFFAAEVSDDEVVYAGHPGEWSGDAVNLFLKLETEEGVGEYIFKFSCAGTRYAYYQRQSFNSEEYAWGASWAAETETGYIVKAEIPFRNLALLDPGSCRVWFNVSLEDNGQGGYMILRGRTEGLLNAPEWIEAKFEDES